MKDKLNSELPSAEMEAQALDWFVRRTAGLDNGEEDSFQEWLHSSTFHIQAFKRWERDWDAFDALPRAEIDRLRGELVRPEPGHRRNPLHAEGGKNNKSLSPISGGFFSYAWKMGMGLAVLVVGLFAWSYWWQPVFSDNYMTARGEQKDIVLPDGSHIFMDTDSKANVAFYRGHRNVSLPGGQAAFAVQGDAKRPFHVDAGPLRITVVGTRFSVRYTPGIQGQDGVHVAVEEGRVRIASKEGKQMVELTGGQQVASTAEGLLGDISAIPWPDIAPWRHSRISFDNVPLRQVIAEFERYGDTRLVISDPAAGKLRLTGTFNPRHLENFARVLPQVLPVRLSQHNGAVEIRTLK